MDMSEVAPLETEYDELNEGTVLDVRSPTATRVERSLGVKAEPVMDADVGFSFIVKIYFSMQDLAVALYEGNIVLVKLTLESIGQTLVFPHKCMPVAHARNAISNSSCSNTTTRNGNSPQNAYLCKFGNFSFNLG
jgi:hypothetical protein